MVTVNSSNECIVRYAAIFTNLYPEWLFDINWDEKRIDIYYDSACASVYFDDNFEPYWDKFDDGSYDSKKAGWNGGFNYFHERSLEILELYNSDKDFKEEIEQFKIDYVNGVFQQRKNKAQLKGCIQGVLIVVIFILAATVCECVF